jgi:hypothetical protein
MWRQDGACQPLLAAYCNAAMLAMGARRGESACGGDMAMDHSGARRGPGAAGPPLQKPQRETACHILAMEAR